MANVCRPSSVVALQLQPRVQRIPQPIADVVRRQRAQHDGQARFAGYETGPLEARLPAADVIVTATGAARVLTAQRFPLLKTGSFLLNVGHTAEEIDITALRPRKEVLP